MTFYYPMLSGSKIQIEQGERNRAAVIQKAKEMKTWKGKKHLPFWFQKILRIRSAGWWCGLGAGFNLSDTTLRRHDGQWVKVRDLPSDLFTF